MNRKNLFIAVISSGLLTLVSFFVHHRVILTKENGKTENETEFRKEWWQTEYDLMKDPATGIIPANARQLELEAAARVPAKAALMRGENLNTYQTAGPNNLGGRTRCVQYDVRYDGSTNRVLIAGGVNGGIFKSVDGGQSWTWKATQSINSVTTIAQDTRTGNNLLTGRPYRDTWYAGTGESFPSSSAPGAFVVGYGLYISDDNGDTWTAMSFSQPVGSSVVVFDQRYDIINRIVVHPVTGDLYVARYGDIIRVQRTALSFFVRTQSLGSSSVSGINTLTQMSDIIINSTGTKIFAAFHGSNTLVPSSYSQDFEGVWESTTGDSANWTKIADATIFPGGWRAANNFGRVVLALAPLNQNLLYALADNLKKDDASNRQSEADLYKINTASLPYTFTNLSANVPNLDESTRGFEVQDGYDMCITINPGNSNTIIIGGVNAIRSTDGFTSLTNQKLIGGYAISGSGQFAYDLTHPDIHWLTWRPGSGTEMIMCTDGGIHLTSNATAATVTYSNLNNSYQSLQYYHVAIDPTDGQNTFLGGAQDNHCTLRNGLSATPNDHNSIIIGDGIAVGLSSVINGSKYAYVSAQTGVLRRNPLNPADNSIGSTSGNIQPTSASSEFKTYFYLDPENSTNLYYAGLNKLYRTTSATTVSAGTWTELTGFQSATTVDTIRSMATTRGAYKTTNNLFIGTNKGKIWRLKDPVNAAASTQPTQVFSLGSNATVIDIAVNPRNDDTVLAVLSNYNTQSIWISNNANSAVPTWTSVEGNIAEPSVRSCEIIVKSTGVEYYVGTSVGLYSTVTLSGGATAWVKEGAGTALEYAIVNSLAQRYSDNVLVIGTHGNGMWFANIGSPGIVTGFNPVINDKGFITKSFPTVANDQLYYQTGNLTGIRSMYIEVTDMMGRKVYHNQAAFQAGSIPVGRLSAGVYVFTALSDNKHYKYVTEFVKK